MDWHSYDKRLGFDSDSIILISTPLGDFKEEGTSLKLAEGSSLKNTSRVDYHFHYSKHNLANRRIGLREEEPIEYRAAIKLYRGQSRYDIMCSERIVKLSTSARSSFHIMSGTL